MKSSRKKLEEVDGGVDRNNGVKTIEEVDGNQKLEGIGRN